MMFAIEFRLRSAPAWEPWTPVGTVDDRKGVRQKLHKRHRPERSPRTQMYPSLEAADRARLEMELRQPQCEFQTVPLETGADEGMA